MKRHSIAVIALLFLVPLSGCHVVPMATQVMPAVGFAIRDAAIAEIITKGGNAFLKWIGQLEVRRKNNLATRIAPRTDHPLYGSWLDQEFCVAIPGQREHNPFQTSHQATSFCVPSSQVMFERPSVMSQDWRLTLQSERFLYPRQRTAGVQISLKDLHERYDPGQIDGIEGPRTRRAVQRFQQDYNLPVTGRALDIADLLISPGEFVGN